jgi:hypothetical protein
MFLNLLVVARPRCKWRRGPFHLLNSSGNFAIFAASRRALSLVNNLLAEREGICFDSG